MRAKKKYRAALTDEKCVRVFCEMVHEQDLTMKRMTTMNETRQQHVRLSGATPASGRGLHRSGGAQRVQPVN